jgi:hypothetical protein
MQYGYESKLGQTPMIVGLQMSEKGRILTLWALLLMSIVFLAWFDGGEEALRPIAQPVELSGLGSKELPV